MLHLRSLIARHRAFALALLALTLAIRALIPAGTMIGGTAQALTVQICDGYADGASAHSAVVTLSRHGDAGKALPDHQPCAFSALGQASLGGTDPLLVLAAIAFIMLLGQRPDPVPARPAPRRLRPPLRAPPSFA
jgi:hypothetical protein